MTKNDKISLATHRHLWNPRPHRFMCFILSFVIIFGPSLASFGPDLVF